MTHHQRTSIHVSTWFLRSVILGLGAAVFAICMFALPQGIVSDNTGGYRPILAGLYLPAVPFFIALYQTLNLLRYIDKNIAFSDLSVKALRTIRRCATAILLLFTIGLPYIFMMADKDDAPGVFALALVIVCASAAIGVFAAVLEKLLVSAIEMKKENELTV